jgi:hypothetical protein
MSYPEVTYQSSYFLIAQRKLPSDLASARNLEQITLQQTQYNDKQRFKALMDNNITFQGAEECHPACAIRKVYETKNTNVKFN